MEGTVATAEQETQERTFNQEEVNQIVQERLFKERKKYEGIDIDALKEKASKFDQMEEAPNKNYIFRTEWNVVHSDATLIITNRVPLSGGTKRTADFCEKHKKPYLVAGRSALLCEIADWLVNLYETLSRENLVINVAGPRESKAKGIQEETRKVIREIISIQRLVERHFGSRMAAKPRPPASAPNSAV